MYQLLLYFPLCSSSPHSVTANHKLTQISISGHVLDLNTNREQACSYRHTVETYKPIRFAHC